MTRKLPKIVNLVSFCHLQVTNPQMKPEAVKIEKAMKVLKAFLKTFKEPGDSVCR